MSEIIIVVPTWFFYVLSVLVIATVIDTAMTIALRILKHKVVKIAAKQAATEMMDSMKKAEYRKTDGP